jgi:sugar phosphate permease
MTSLFVAALPLGGVVAGPLSGWIMEGMQGAYGLRGWQWLFIAEGLPTIVLGIVAFFYLTDNVESASWLSKEEKNIVKSDLEADRAIHHTKAEHKFTQALRNPQVWLLSLVYFCYFCILNTILIWTPTLLKGMGVKTITSVGWLVCLISLIGTIGMILVGRSSDRMMERRWHVALCGIMASICFLLLPIASESIALTVGLLCVAAIGIYGLQGIFWTIPQIYLQGTAAAGGIALISSLGAMSGFFSPTVVGWIKQTTGSLYIGFGVVAVVAIIGMVVLLVTFPPPAARKTT